MKLTRLLEQTKTGSVAHVYGTVQPETVDNASYIKSAHDPVVITSLEGSPKFVFKNFVCIGHPIKDLKGGPESVLGKMDCGRCQLTSLEGGPKFLEAGRFDNNKLTSLHNIHKQLPSVGYSLSFIDNPIKSHVLGLLKIKGLEIVGLDNQELEAIINKHLPEGNIFDCQAELEDAGLEAYAQL